MEDKLDASRYVTTFKKDSMKYDLWMERRRDHAKFKDARSIGPPLESMRLFYKNRCLVTHSRRNEDARDQGSQFF